MVAPLSSNRSAALYLALPVVPAVTILATTHDVAAVFWCSPAIILCYLVLSARLAGACSALLFVVAAITVNPRVDAGTAISVGLSLSMVVPIVVAILRLRGDLNQLAEQAITDPLTGAFNRRHLNACLTAAIERRNRTGEPASLLLFDIDRFKEINDALGHQTGDYVLKALVALIQRRARTLDAVFRTGGEEFALLPANAPFADALTVAEEIRARVATATLLDGRQVSISVGVCEARASHSAHDWMEDADEALYSAKRGGRNRIAGAHMRPGLTAARPNGQRVFAGG